MHKLLTGSLTARALLLTLAVLSVQPEAHAAEVLAAAGAAAPVDEAQMQAQMHRYFTGEGRGGIWLMGAGASAAALGTGLLCTQSSFARGVAYPLLGFGAIELVGGLAFYLNTLRRVPRFERQIHGQPSAFRAAESARIATVNRQMRLLEVAEVSLILAGGVMTSIGALNQQDLVAGIGTGLLIETAVLLIYDQLAARRALRYTEALAGFSVAVNAGHGLGPRGAMLTFLRPF